MRRDINSILLRTAYLSAAIVIIFMAFGVNFLTKNGIMKISSVVSIVTIFWAFYFSFGWKWPVLKYLIRKQNLNGTWFGTYRSKNIITDEIYEGSIALVIRQSFLRIHITSYTDKFINSSYSELLKYSDDSDSHELIYVYAQNDFRPIDDSTRRGTSELRLKYDNEFEEFFGNFWTNHNSQGFLNLRKVNKEHARSFNEAQSFTNDNIE